MFSFVCKEKVFLESGACITVSWAARGNTGSCCAKDRMSEALRRICLSRFNPDSRQVRF